MAIAFFFIAAVFVFAGAIGVVGLSNPFYNVLALVTHLFGLAGMFLLLRAQFIAAAQVIVYARPVITFAELVSPTGTGTMREAVGGHVGTPALEAEGERPGGEPVRTGW